MASSNTAVETYLAGLPEDRRAAVAAVRKAILKNLPKGYEEQVGSMLNYVIPLARYPKTYNKQPLMLASLASQKSHMALYWMGGHMVPELEEWLREAFRKAGKTLDMGKSCVRFKALDDLPLDVIGEAMGKLPVEAYIAQYEKAKPPKKPAAKAG